MRRMRRTSKISTASPTEADEQKLLFDWLELAEIKYPELELAYHVANEGRRSYWTGYELKRQGMRPGVPDICIPVPRGQYGALYIEMKRPRGGRVTNEQRWWIDHLNRAGNYAVVCHGFDEARDVILHYITGAIHGDKN